MDRRVYIAEAAERLDRKPGTLRKWDDHNVLPEYLRCKKDERGWRYWNESQIGKIREWIRENDFRPGKGLPNYNPSPEKVREHLQNIRKPKTRLNP